MAILGVWNFLNFRGIGADDLIIGVLPFTSKKPFKSFQQNFKHLFYYTSLFISALVLIIGIVLFLVEDTLVVSELHANLEQGMVK